ncbi:MAG: hypothetical protein OXG04_19490 [Acidobacteria bacterium]|nr:hypothetical protein [Acidobacteriota bacterium]
MGRTRLPEDAEAVRSGWTEGELLRLHLHELPRSLFDLSRERQVELLDERPPPTGTPWDALLAAVVEHMCEIRDLPVPEWTKEKERFREIAWIVGNTHEERLVATAYAPAAFIRHGALPDPRSLDACGGERHVWVPGSQPQHEALRRALRRA